MAVLWGFILPMLVIVLAQFGFSIPAIPARLLSLLQEAAGIVMLVGTVYLLKRRVQLGGQTPSKDAESAEEAEAPKRTLLPMVILLVILASGFLAEASRLSITGNATAWASPMGWILSLGTPASPLFMQMMIRLHFFAVLLFIAAIPFTFMRHLAATPLNVFYKKMFPYILE